MVLTHFGIFELTPERVVGGVPAKCFRTGWKLFHMKENVLFSISVAVPVSKSYSSKVMSMGTILCWRIFWRNDRFLGRLVEPSPGLRSVTVLEMTYMMLLTVLIHTVNGSRLESGCFKSCEHSQQMALTHFWKSDRFQGRVDLLFPQRGSYKCKNSLILWIYIVYSFIYWRLI